MNTFIPANANRYPDLTLTGSLLVAQYNEMVATAIDLGMRAAEVNRFATNAKGVERTEVLHKNIQVRAQALRDADAEAAERAARIDSAIADAREANTTEAKGEASPREMLEQAEHAHEAATQAVVETTQGNSAPETEETLERLPNESEEDYMARKAAKKTARGKTRTKATDKPKAEAKAGPRRSVAGTTIREKTEEYNRLVPAARKAGIEWAKHHTSNFESQEKADKQIARLKDAMKKAVK